MNVMFKAANTIDFPFSLPSRHWLLIQKSSAMMILSFIRFTQFSSRSATTQFVNAHFQLTFFGGSSDDDDDAAPTTGSEERCYVKEKKAVTKGS